MYKRNSQGWIKHLDFIVLDEISLMLAFYTVRLYPAQSLGFFYGKLPDTWHCSGAA